MILTDFVGRILNLWQTVEPQQRKRSGDEQKHSRQSGKPSREFGLLGFEDQARAQVFVYFAQVGFALCFRQLKVSMTSENPFQSPPASLWLLSESAQACEENQFPSRHDTAIHGTTVYIYPEISSLMPVGWLLTLDNRGETRPNTFAAHGSAVLRPVDCRACNRVAPEMRLAPRTGNPAGTSGNSHTYTWWRRR